MNLLNALKNQKNLDVGLSGFVGNKDNLDIASKISYQNSFVPTTAEKYSKNNEKNKSFILL